MPALSRQVRNQRKEDFHVSNNLTPGTHKNVLDGARKAPYWPVKFAAQLIIWLMHVEFPLAQMCAAMLCFGNRMAAIAEGLPNAAVGALAEGRMFAVETKTLKRWYDKDKGVVVDPLVEQTNARPAEKTATLRTASLGPGEMGHWKALAKELSLETLTWMKAAAGGKRDLIWGDACAVQQRFRDLWNTGAGEAARKPTKALVERWNKIRRENKLPPGAIPQLHSLRVVRITITYFMLDENGDSMRKALGGLAPQADKLQEVITYLGSHSCVTSAKGYLRARPCDLATFACKASGHTEGHYFAQLAEAIKVGADPCHVKGIRSAAEWLLRGHPILEAKDWLGLTEKRLGMGRKRARAEEKDEDEEEKDEE